MVPVMKLPMPAFEILVTPLSVNAPAVIATLPVVALISPVEDVMPDAPVMAPLEEIMIEGVLRKLVNPVAEEILMPLTVPPADAKRLMRFEVFVPEEGVDAAPCVMVMPFTATPAPVLLFLKMKFARLLALEARRLGVKLWASPEVPVEREDKAGLLDPEMLNPPVP